ncbi:MAG: S8 family serine peptidase [Verrucomicrobiales bacterium]|nr:S8 family serine peptidase [Verrucomicrobiales bacterium]
MMSAVNFRPHAAIPPGFVRLALLTFGLCRAAAEDFPDKWVILQNGRPVVHEIVRDEVARPGVRGLRVVEKVAMQPNAEALRKRLAGTSRNLILREAGDSPAAGRRRLLTDRVLVRLVPGVTVEQAAAHGGAVAVQRLEPLTDRVIFHAPATPGAALLLARKLQQFPGALEAQPLLARQHVRKAIPNDPLFSNVFSSAGYQWHLRNTGARGGTAGIDVNVAAAWDSWLGRNVTVGVVDDGLLLTHPDLQQNAAPDESYDFNEDDADPMPGPADRHGTACAGAAAARGNNGIGISGVAPEAKLAGLRLIAGPSSDDQDAEAFLFHEQTIAIKSNSWGPDDDGATLAAPEALSTAALEHAATFGRGGKGTVFVWAAGNGASAGDNSNFDGWANSVHVIAVSAIGDTGTASWYSEPGANILVCAPSDHSGGHQEITTTDLPGADGFNTGGASGNYPDAAYTNDFGGTSAACPLVAGVVALMLEANPALSVRDVQEILVRTAVRNDPANSGWITNGAGFHFNHQYGAGLVNASAAAVMASGWTPLPPVETRTLTQSALALAVPDNNASGVNRTFSFSPAEDLRVEHVTVAVDVTHPIRGQLAVDLTSPAGTVSRMAVRRTGDFGDDLVWTMSTTHCRGESAAGTWTVKVADKAPGTTGTLNAVSLTLIGSVSAPTAAPDMPDQFTATARKGSPFYFRIAARYGPGSFSSGLLPAGLALDAASGQITGIPTVTGEFDVPLTALNAAGTDTGSLHLSILAGFGDAVALAVDESAHHWSTTESRPWTLVTDPAHDLTDAARSPAMGDLAAASMQTSVIGPLSLDFWWKVSSEPGHDFLRLLVDGEEAAKISGEADWTAMKAALPAGSHVVQWEYRKDDQSAAGLDGAWVDGVTFALPDSPRFVRVPQAVCAPVGSRSGFMAQAIGAEPMSYQWTRNGSPLTAPDRPVLILPLVSPTDAGAYAVTVTNMSGSATSPAVPLTATASEDSTGFAAALGSTGMSWGSAPNAWTIQTGVVFSPPSALRAASIGHLQQSRLDSLVQGPAALSFQWKADSEMNGDFARFRLDGIPLAQLSGQTLWVPFALNLPAGPHWLSWSYEKDASGSSGADAAFLDSVVLTPLRFDSYAHTIFSAAQLQSGSGTGPEDDADADGADNFCEYAFGTDPTVPSQAPVPSFGQTLADGEHFLTIRFRRRSDFPVRGLTYTLLSTEGGGVWMPADVVPVSITTDGAFDTVTVRMQLPLRLAGPRMLFKVRASE